MCGLYGTDFIAPGLCQHGQALVILFRLPPAQRDGRRKFVKAGDKMGKLTRPILPLPLFEHRLLKNTSELTIIPLGTGLLPLTGDLPTPPPPRLLLNSGPEDRRGQCPAGPMKLDKRPTLPSLQPPPGLRGPDSGPTSRGESLSAVKAEPLAGGGARDARRGKEEPGLVRTCLGESGNMHKLPCPGGYHSLRIQQMHVLRCDKRSETGFKLTCDGNQCDTCRSRTENRGTRYKLACPRNPNCLHRLQTEMW